MKSGKKLSRVFNSSKEIELNDMSKIIIFSDVHRGDNTLSDNFAKNQEIFIKALKYYFVENYTYIEIGDGDELWENKYLNTIVTNHLDVFKLLSKFYEKGKLFMLFGNHDIIKRYISLNKKKKLINNHESKFNALFLDIEIYEGLILNYKNTGKKIFLIHGHQGDFLNDDIWMIARFLVRYFWRPLELIGIKNPTRVCNNKKKKLNVEKNLISWIKKNKILLIAGHTHKVAFPKKGEDLYFNDGCCVYPDYITGIEICNGSISMVKWWMKSKNDKSFIYKDIVEGPIKIKYYFESLL